MFFPIIDWSFSKIPPLTAFCLTAFWLSGCSRSEPVLLFRNIESQSYLKCNSVAFWTAKNTLNFQEQNLFDAYFWWWILLVANTFSCEYFWLYILLIAYTFDCIHFLLYTLLIVYTFDYIYFCSYLFLMCSTFGQFSRSHKYCYVRVTFIQWETK